MRDQILQRAKILIVNDEVDHLNVLTGILQMEGYRNLKSTTDSRAVHDLYITFQPDLILVDGIMPAPNGFGVLSQLQALIPQETYLPILVISGDISSQSVRDALANGATDYVTKPFDDIEVVQRVGNLLNARFLHLQLQEKNHLLEKRVQECNQMHQALQETYDELEVRVSKRTAELAIANEQLRTEVSERQKAQAELQEHHNLLRTVTDGCNDAIFIKDLQGRYLMINAAGAGYRGKTAQEIIGRVDTDLFSPETALIFTEADRQVLANGATRTWEETTTEAGKVRTHLVTKGTYRGHRGEAIGIFGIARDITERKQMEDELEARERRFRAMIEHSGDGITLTDAAGTYLYCSRAACRITGYDEGKLLGHSIFEFVHPDDQEVFRLMLSQLAPGSSVAAEYRIRHSDGSWRWIESISTNLLAEPSVQAIVGNFRDITPRKQAEKALQQSEERFRTLFETMAQGVVYHDASGHIIAANRATETMLGLTRDQLMGKTSIDPRWRAIHEDGSEFPGEAHPMVVARETGQEVKNVFMGVYNVSEGEYRWLNVHAIPQFKNGEERPYQVFASFEDITSRKRTEEKLQKSRARLAEAQRLTHLGNWERDLTTNEVSWSDELYRIYGFQPQEFVPTFELFGELIHPDDREMVEGHITRAFRNHEPFVCDFRFIRADGEIRIQHAIGNVILSEAGQAVRIFGSAQDVTELRQTEAALNLAKEEAERSNRAKSEFIARMSHELRTPLNAILGFGQLFELEKLEEEEQENVEEILRAGRHLLHLINEVLDIARIESGRMAFSLEAVCVQEVVDEVIGLVRPLATERNIRIEKVADAEEEECHILADRQRLKQVLLNLMSNAVKYNRQGGNVRLSWEECAKDTGQEDTGQEDTDQETTTPSPWMKISVVDTGLGIAEKDLDKVFEPFERIGAEQSSVEGTGIGLAISKRLVELMGGTINVSSVVGSGSTFWLELPRMSDPLMMLDEPLPTSYSAVVQSPPLVHQRKTVLYIEDNLSNLKLIQRILAHHVEINLIAAMQGQLGLDLAREHHLDLILLDFHLPDILGDEVLRRLQADPETCEIPVVMISADATPGQIERLLAAGVREYLTKPLDVKRFLEVLEEILKAPQQ